MPRRRSGASARASGIVDLFGGSGEPAPLFLTAAEPWPPAERLQREFAAIGTYLSAHPIDDYADLVQARGGLTWKAFLEQLRDSTASSPALVAATVVQRQERRTRTGGRIGIVTLSDPTAQFEATVYQERLADWREHARAGALAARCSSAASSTRRRRRCAPASRALEPLEAMAAAQGACAIRIFLDAPEPIERLASRLDRGEGTVSVVAHAEGARGGGETSRPVSRDPAGLRRDQGGARRATRRDGLKG